MRNHAENLDDSTNVTDQKVYIRCVGNKDTERVTEILPHPKKNWYAPIGQGLWELGERHEMIEGEGGGQICK